MSSMFNSTPSGDGHFVVGTLRTEIRPNGEEVLLDGTNVELTFLKGEDGNTIIMVPALGDLGVYPTRLQWPGRRRRDDDGVMEEELHDLDTEEEFARVLAKIDPQAGFLRVLRDHVDARLKELQACLTCGENPCRCPQMVNTTSGS